MSSPSARILVVDDDPAVRNALSRDLTRLGYVCMTASDGRGGLQEIASGHVDVALMDLFMPQMDGLALLRAIEEARTDTVSIILTGYGDVSKAVAATRLGAFDFIEKPASVQTIQKAIERAMKYRRLLMKTRTMSLLAEQWENTFDSWPDLVVILDEDLRVLRLNDVAASHAGCRKQDLVGRNCHEALCGNDHPVDQCPFSIRPTPSGEPAIQLQQAAWGGHFEFTAVCLSDSSGCVWGSMHISRDVTNRAKASKAILRMHKQTENLLASISAVLIGVDTENRVTQWNSDAERAFGIEARNAIGVPFNECSIPWEWPRVLRHMEAVKRFGKTMRIEDFRYIRSDGQERFLTLTVNPITDDQGECSGLVVLGTDSTERKLLESQLAQAQKLESIGFLAAGIAHEINTPTQYVDSNIYFLKTAFDGIRTHLERCSGILSKAGQEAKHRDLIEKLKSSERESDLEYLCREVPGAIADALEGLRRVSTIVGAMKEFSHPGKQDKTPTDINKVIESIVTVTRNEWKYVADIVKELDPALPLVPCLPDDLGQAVLNMIINAAHAIEEVVGDGSNGKGTITISTRKKKGCVEIRIQDTGSGIPEEYQSKVFDPFFTTKEVGRGTGQGLAIVHDVVVHKHGGAIRFDTELGRGTTFTVQIPLMTGVSCLENVDEYACALR